MHLQGTSHTRNFISIGAIVCRLTLAAIEFFVRLLLAIPINISQAIPIEPIQDSLFVHFAQHKETSRFIAVGISVLIRDDGECIYHNCLHQAAYCLQKLIILILSIGRSCPMRKRTNLYTIMSLACT